MLAYVLKLSVHVQDYIIYIFPSVVLQCGQLAVPSYKPALPYHTTANNCRG